MKQFIRLFKQHANFAIVYFDIPHVLARIERREWGGRIDNLCCLVLALDPILRTPNRNAAAETKHGNNKTRPV